MKKRNLNVDLLKIIACAAVIGLHTQNPETGNINAILYYMCGFAVPIFFMCTGFFVLDKESITYGYSVRKCKRILRIIVVWNVIAVCLMMLLKNIKWGGADSCSLNKRNVGLLISIRRFVAFLVFGCYANSISVTAMLI